MPYRLVAFTEHEVDMAALGFQPDIITANTLLRADLRNDDDAASLQEVRDRRQFRAETGYDLRHDLPD